MSCRFVSLSVLQSPDHAPAPCHAPAFHRVRTRFFFLSNPSIARNGSIDRSFVHRPHGTPTAVNWRFAQVMSYSHECTAADSVSIGNGKLTMEADVDCTSSTTGASNRASGAQQSAAFPFTTMHDIIQAQERCTRTSAPERRLPMLVPAQLSGPSASAPLLPRRIILLASGPTVSYGTDSSQVCTQAPSICSASSPRRPATRRRRPAARPSLFATARRSPRTAT